MRDSTDISNLIKTGNSAETILKNKILGVTIMYEYTNLLYQAEKLRRHNRQGSYKTRERYFEAYKRFLRFLGEEYHLQKLSNISGKHLSAYISFMKDKGYSASTVKTDLSAIRFWHDKISGAKYTLPQNTAFTLKRREFGKVDRTWSNEEFEKMRNECKKAGHDDYEACMVIARYAGLRIHEVLRIDTAIARKAVKSKVLTIKGKGGKVRQVPINNAVEMELRKFLLKTPMGQKLFVPEEKESHTVIWDIQHFIASHRKKISDEGRETNLTFHGLRHTYASEKFKQLIAAGYSDAHAKKVVSKLLGHERPDVTKIYLAGVLKGGGKDV